MPGADEFDARLTELGDAVGSGRIRAQLDVNQAYAQNHHQTTTWVHRHGGGPFYLSVPLMESHMLLLQNIADKVITNTGSDIERGMIETAEAMSAMVETFAPGDGGTDELRHSGHPTVDRNGVTIYDRPPVAPRRPEGLPHR